MALSLRLLPNSRLVPQAVAGALLVAAAVYLASDAAGAPAALAVAFAAADEAHEAMQPALPHWNAEVNKFSSVAGIPRALKWLTSGVLEKDGPLESHVLRACSRPGESSSPFYKHEGARCSQRSPA